jgi:hypothetical protein
MKVVIFTSTGLLIILIFALGLFGQDPVRATPLESSREDLIKIHSGEVRLDDGSSYFESKNENVTVMYYSSGCDNSVAKELKLASNTVVQVKRELKYKMSLATEVNNTIDRYERIPLGTDEFVYIDHRYGSVIFTEGAGNYPEMVKTVYNVPKTRHLAKCLLDRIDTRLRKLFENSDHWKSEEETEYGDSVLLDDPDFSTSTLIGLDHFYQMVNRSERNRGVVYVHAGAGSGSPEVLRWTKKLQEHFDKYQGTGKSRIKFISQGSAERPKALLVVTYKNIR